MTPGQIGKIANTKEGAALQLVTASAFSVHDDTPIIMPSKSFIMISVAEISGVAL